MAVNAGFGGAAKELTRVRNQINTLRFGIGRTRQQVVAENWAELRKVRRG